MPEVIVFEQSYIRKGTIVNRSTAFPCGSTVPLVKKQLQPKAIVRIASCGHPATPLPIPSIFLRPPRQTPRTTTVMPIYFVFSRDSAVLYVM